MPGHPIKTCLPCRAIKDIAVKAKTNVTKNIKLYAFFTILLIELFSIRFASSFPAEVYAYKVYPMLANLEFFVIFLAIYLYAEKLRFCVRQKLIVIALMVYFVFNVLTLFFPICWSAYYVYGSYGILAVIAILFLATWKNL